MTRGKIDAKTFSETTVEFPGYIVASGFELCETPNSLAKCRGACGKKLPAKATALRFFAMDTYIDHSWIRKTNRYVCIECALPFIRGLAEKVLNLHDQLGLEAE